MLIEAVESVVHQHYSNIEIIIVDDGSSDDTNAIALTLAAQYKFITVIRIENSGPAVARESGRALARGEFIQYLDSDDLLHPEKFRKQVKALDTNLSCGVSYCIQQLCNMRGEILDSAWMRTGVRFETMFPSMLGGRIWGTPVPLYRSSVLQTAGPWLDIRNQEDWEYDCRVASLGVSLDYQAEVLVTIRRHDERHFGQIGEHQKQKLIDKSKAYQAIYTHARSAKIPKHHAESLRFNRMVFLLARQCAKQGLKQQAQALINICKDASVVRNEKMEYTFYSLLSFVFGWKNIGTASFTLERWRR